MDTRLRPCICGGDYFFMTRKIFYDQNNNEMSFWINDNNQIFIQISDSDNPMLANFITIDKEDAQELVDDLQYLVNEL